MSSRGFNVIYPRIRLGGGVGSAYYLGNTAREVTTEVARGVQAVLQSAYSAQFELPRGTLPLGAITRHLCNPADDKKVAEQRTRMLEHMERGSEYWIARDLQHQHNTIVAVSKVTPQGENTYVNDVIVAEAYQKYGYGSIVAHAALRFGSSQHDASVSLDGFEGNPVNKWFQETWGLEPGELCGEGFVVGEHVLPQRRFASPDQLTVRGVVAALEKKNPGLVSGRIFPAA